MGTGRGGMRCIKILLCIFNTTFWLAGLAVIAFGLWLRFGGVMADFTSDKRSPEYFFMGLYVLVGAGALMTTVGFFGCCGAARESQCLLGAFFACLLVIFAAEITAGVFAFIGKKVAIQEAQKIYEDIYDDYMKNPGGKANRTIYHFHMAFQCCGKDGIEQQMGLPCPENIQLPKSCLFEIQKVIDANLHLVGIVGIAIAGITVSKSMFSFSNLYLSPVFCLFLKALWKVSCSNWRDSSKIFGMIFSMVLCCAIRNTRDMI